MPSSLTRVLPFACVSSTRLPVSVCGTGGWPHSSRAFSRPGVPPASSPEGDDITGVTRLPPQSTQRPDFPRVCALAPPSGTGILTGCPSPAPSGLGLGPTNPTRTDLPSETSSFRRTWFSHVSRYSCQHSHFHALQHPSQNAFAARGTLPYQLPIPQRRSATPGLRRVT